MSRDQADPYDGRGSIPWSFVLALLFASINLRAPFVAVAPVSTDIRSGLGIGGGALGLLTSLPVLCFGVTAPVALLAIRRIGAELGLAWCLLLVLVGTAVRSVGPFWLALLATLLMGFGITIGNIVVPVLIRRDVPSARVGMVTGAYASTMNVGSMLVSITTAPLAALVGWRTALAAWVVVVGPALLLWLAFVRRRNRRPLGPDATGSLTSETDGAPVWRRSVAWLLAIAFAGQAWAYYGLTAWLPTLLVDELGLGKQAAGVASSTFQICALIGAFGAPLLAMRAPAWTVFAVLGGLWMCCPLLLMIAPHLFVPASVIGGIAQGGGFTAIFTAVVRVARSDRDSAQLATFVQGTGYIVGALGPAALGIAHDTSGGWRLPLALVLGATLAFTVAGSAAALRARRQTAAVAALADG